MARRPFDKQQAIDYLAARGIHTKSTNETYLKRVYNSVKKQEQQGLEPSLKRARRGETEFKYVPRSQKDHTLARWEIKTKLASIRAFLRANPRKDRFTFIVTGIASEDSPNRRKQRDTSKPITLGIGQIPRQFVLDSLDMAEAMEREEGQQAALVAFVNDLGQIGQDWERIDDISILDYRGL